MRILVTGSAGFIGFHLSKALLDRGDEVIGVDCINDAYNPQIKYDRNNILKRNLNYKFYQVDFGDYSQFKKVFEENKIEKICHLGARAGVLPSIKDPHSYIHSNIVGTTNVFQLAKEFNVPKVVFASSSSVYGKNEKYPSSEDDPVDRPISLYAATKKANELMAHTYYHLFGMEMIGLRFFNVYGEWGRSDMMPWIFTENIIRNKPLQLNNNGDTWKDYTYIEDIVRGIIAALDTTLGYQIINLGNNTPVHLKKCVEIIEKEVGEKAQINLAPLQMGDVIKSCADISKAEKLLNWKPKVKIEDGLPKFIKWYKEYKGINNGN